MSKAIPVSAYLLLAMFIILVGRDSQDIRFKVLCIVGSVGWVITAALYLLEKKR